jgi:hypothetical protein
MPENNTSSNQQSLTLETYVDRLLEEKDLEVSSPEVQEQLKKDLLVRVEDAINTAIITNLPERVLPEMENTLKTGNVETVQKLAAKHIKNLDQVVAEALLRFRRTYINP